MVNTRDALTTAKFLLDEHGGQDAWRILTERAIQEHVAGDGEHLAITLQVQAALRVLTKMEPDRGERVQ